MTFPDFEIRNLTRACALVEHTLATGPALASAGAPEPAEGEQLEFDFEQSGGQRQDEHEPSCTKGASRQS